MLPAFCIMPARAYRKAEGSRRQRAMIGSTLATASGRWTAFMLASWNMRLPTSDRACFILRVRAPEDANSALISFAALNKAAQSAFRADAGKFESSAQEWGFRIGSQIYDAYLAGKIAPVRGFAACSWPICMKPGVARKMCAAVISRLRSFSRSVTRAAHA